ncbi:Fructose import ATP-binding protein FrcA [bioreactor metagenome]|uniref:Fructose import ATP-binding protein FrcA n=1 Tax=bioreactor metagenome TaxID=1076179 RepID=A0A644W1K9_9ZZZZ
MSDNNAGIQKGDVVIEAKNIIKTYGHLQALKGANFSACAGEITALLGDNGAGKSTLANIICGAIPKTSGQLFCRGKEITAQSIQNAQDLGIYVVYQDLALAPDLSVPNNIFLGKEIIKDSFFGKLFKILDNNKMTKISKDHLADLGIGLKSMTVPVKSLSGGERQSLAVAKAVAWANTALIMDEPTAALGARQQALVYKTMRAAAEKNLAVVVISHDIPKMLEVSDRICIMRQGEVVADLVSKDTNLQTVLSLMLTGQA